MNLAQINIYIFMLSDFMACECYYYTIKNKL